MNPEDWTDAEFAEKLELLGEYRWAGWFGRPEGVDVYGTYHRLSTPARKSYNHLQSIERANVYSVSRAVGATEDELAAAMRKPARIPGDARSETAAFRQVIPWARIVELTLRSLASLKTP
ncbi:MAG: hypothetical protein LBH13_00570 [Cellulomonadaceae bacterium]|jgi:hypothetical protein|nr:hypothetical protein [Cellulomonadaceae bacterium]